MKRRGGRRSSVVVKLGGHRYRIEVVPRPKVSEVAGGSSSGKRKPPKRPKGHKRGCRCVTCRLH